MRKVATSPNDALTVNLKQSLLDRLERHCTKSELTKSQVISIALKRFLASELAADPSFWDALYDKYDENGKL